MANDLAIDPALIHRQLAGYEKAEIALLLAEKTRSGEFFNLLTLIELVPAEQEDSLPIGQVDFPNVVRTNADEYTIYAIRLNGLTVRDAVDLYVNADKGMTLKNGRVNVRYSCIGRLTENPPAAHPLMITNVSQQLRSILPHRLTAMRVWTQLNMDKEWLKGFSGNFMRKVSDLSIKHFGYDLNGMPEHLGNVYLFGCNPLLRSWDCRLVDYDKALLFHFNQREGQRISACKLILEEVRGDQGGFYLEHKLEIPDTLISLPYFPDRLHVRLFDSNGHWIEHSLINWANFSFDIAVQDKTVDYHVQTESGIQVFSVPKHISATSVNVGTYDWTAAH